MIWQAHRNGWACAAMLLVLTATSAVAQPAFDYKYSKLVAHVGNELDVAPALIHAVIFAESKYQPDAVSKSGAIGLMQLIPKFGALEAFRYLYGRNRIPTNRALKRPEVSIWLGTAYLSILNDRYFAWIENTALRLRAVIAAYNWGPTAVLSTLFPERTPMSVSRFMTRLETQAPDETRAYVSRVLQRLHDNRTALVRLARNDIGQQKAIIVNVSENNEAP